MTVNGLIPADSMGITLSHEHLLIVHKGDSRDLTDEALAVTELGYYVAAGGKTLVEATAIGIGRNPEGLKRISTATGCNVIMSAGYYKDKWIPDTIKSKSIEQLTDIIINDIVNGKNGIHAGVIKIGTSRPITSFEVKALRAAARAQIATGAAIDIHFDINGPVSERHNALNILESEGADLTRVYISHCTVYDELVPDYITLAQRGCYISFDNLGMEAYWAMAIDWPDPLEPVETIKALINAGYLNQILISQDVCFSALLVQNGGYGYAHILNTLVPQFMAGGITNEQIHTIMVENPKRILAFKSSTDAPVINSTPVKKAVYDHEYLYTVHAIGLPVITYSLVTAPSGMNINSSTGEITWTPSSPSDNGSEVKVRANNGIAPADTQSFRIFVTKAPDCPSNLTGLWKLDETTGTTYSDYYSEHTIEATIAPTPTTGKINGGQTFNATTEMDIPDLGEEFEWELTSDFSFEFWVKTASTKTMVILGRYREDIPEAANWWVGLSGGMATFYLHENDTSANGKEFEITGGPVIADNQWHHIIAVREGSIQENRLYVDGIEVANVSTDYDNSFRSEEPTEINLGWFDYTYTGYHFIGALDEVAIFNKAISDAEAASFYNQGSPAGHCAVGNYPLVITSTPVETAEVDVVYTYITTVDDYEADDPIMLNVTTKPDWLNFNYTAGQRSAVLTGTPASTDKGDHEVVIHATDGKAEHDQTFMVTVTGSEGLEDLEAAGIRIYPVPAKTYLTVQFGQLNEETRMELISAAGSLIKNIVVHPVQTKYTIDLSNINAGAYYLRIINSSLNNIGRFVITK